MIGAPATKSRAVMIGVKNQRRLRTFWAGMVPTVASKPEGRYRNAAVKNAANKMQFGQRILSMISFQWTTRRRLSTINGKMTAVHASAVPRIAVRRKYLLTM